MANIRRSVRDLFLQGVEAVNSAANHVANATRSKVDELNLRNRRKELLDALAVDLYEQWQKGLALPEALTATLEQLRDIDAQLSEIESQSEPAGEPAKDSVEDIVAKVKEVVGGVVEKAEDAVSEIIDKDEAPAGDNDQKTDAAVPTIDVEEEETPEVHDKPEWPDISEIPTIQNDQMDVE